MSDACRFLVFLNAAAFSSPSLLLGLADAAAPLAYGSVDAPPWLLPCGAAACGLLPTLLLGLPGANKQQAAAAPARDTGYATHQHPNCVCVLDAGPKGSGLFATEEIPRGVFLFDYSGQFMDKAAYHAKYPGGCSDYTAAIKTPDGAMFFVDGAHEELGSPSRWMNHDHVSPTVQRRSFFDDGHEPRICMFSARKIAAGEELQWNYGQGYWDAKSSGPVV